MSAHTPGPWRVCGASDDKCQCSYIWSGCGNMIVAQASWEGNPTDEDIPSPTTDAEFQANKRLISAAPDLYEACKAALAKLKSHCTWQEPDTIDLLRAAIEKAQVKP